MLVAQVARSAITKNFGTGSSMLAKIICERKQTLWWLKLMRKLLRRGANARKY
jgi:hypothetical protein